MRDEKTPEEIKCCPKCNLPWDLCRHIDDERSIVTLRSEKRKHNKAVLIISGIKIRRQTLGINENEDAVLKDIASTIQKSVCCGGTVENGEILLQTRDVDNVENQLKTDFGFEVFK